MGNNHAARARRSSEKSRQVQLTRARFPSIQRPDQCQLRPELQTAPQIGYTIACRMSSTLGRAWSFYGEIVELSDREEALIQRAVEGDEVALTTLLVHSRPGLLMSVARKIPPDLAGIVGAEDIVQETFIAVFRDVGTLDSTRPASFHRWIQAVALNQLRNIIKHHRAAKRGGAYVRASNRKKSIEDSAVDLFNLLAGPGRTPSRSVARREAITAVEEAVACLPDRYRQAVQLVHMEGFSVAEAASAMCRTERAIHGLCRRGLKRLETQLLSASRFLSSRG